MEFDAAMQKVRAISGANNEQFLQLRDTAQEMGATTKFSATEAANAMEYMAMAGWKTEDMLGGISGIMNLAAASGEDLATTSDIVTDALTAFGMQAGESSHFADILAAAATNSNTNVGMMGETFKYVAPVAGALGYTAEDVAVAIGLMANSGIKASQAGTSLRGLFTRLAKEPKEAAAAMKVLGVSLDDGAGNMYSFREIMQQLRSSFNENLQIPASEVRGELERLNAKLEEGTITQSKYDKEVETLTERAYGAEGALKAQYAAMLAGTNGMSGLLAIVNASDEDFAKLTTTIDGCSDVFVKTADGSIMSMNQALAEGITWTEEYKGAAEAIATMMEDTLQGDITSLKSAFEGLQIAVADKLTPTFREFVQSARDGIRAITVAFKEDGLQGALQALGPVIDSGIALIFSKLPQVLAAGTSILTSFVNAIITNLPTLIPAGVQIVQQLTDSLIQNLPTLLNASTQILQALSDGLIQSNAIIIPAAIQVIQALAENFLANLPIIVTTAMTLLQQFAVGLAQAIPELVPVAIQIIQQITQSITENISQIVDSAVLIITTLADGLIQVLPELIPAIVQIVLAIVEKLTEPNTLMQLLTAAHQIIIAIAEGLIKALPDLIVAIPVLIANLVKAIIEGRSQMIESGKELFSAIKDGFAQAIPDLINKAKEAAEKPIESIKQKWETAKTIGNLLISTIQNGISEKTGALSESLQKIGTSISDTFKKIAEGAKTHGSNIMASVRSGIASKINEVSSAMRELSSSLGDIFRNLADSALSWGRDLIGNFVSGLQEKLQALKDKAIGIAQQIKDVIGFSEPKEGPLSQFHTFAPDMMELFAKGIKDNASIVTNAVSDSFNLRDQIGAGFNSGTVVSMGGARSVGSGPRTQTIILQVGRTELARLVHELNGEEDERIGLKLVTT